MLYKLIRDAHYAGAVSIHLSRASSNLSLSYFELCNNNYITSSDKSMMNRTLLHLLALSLSVLSTSSLQGPANRRLEFELAEYNSHRHWENGEEKDVYSPPTAAPTTNFVPVEGDDGFGPDSTDDGILDPSDSASSNGGFGALNSILISAGGVVVVAAALYLRRKKGDEEGNANNEGDTSAVPTEDLPSTAADV